MENIDIRVIGIATALSLAIIKVAIEVNKMLFKKKSNNGRNRSLPCKTHEEQIKAHKEQIGVLFAKEEKNDAQFNDLMIGYTQKMTEISTTLSLFIQNNDKEHKAILEAIEKVSNRR